MPKISKIVQLELEKLVLSLAAKGMSSREISKEIKEQKNIIVSYVTVNKFLQETREERAETSKRIIQETIQKTIPTDLENLDNMNNKLLEWFNDENMKKSQRIQIYNSLLKGIELKLKHSGAGEDTITDLTEVLKEKWGLSK